jgi:hypothetical protein
LSIGILSLLLLPTKIGMRRHCRGQHVHAQTLAKSAREEFVSKVCSAVIAWRSGRAFSLYNPK